MCLVVIAVFKTVVGLLWSRLGSIPCPSAIFCYFFILLEVYLIMSLFYSFKKAEILPEG